MNLNVFKGDLKPEHQHLAEELKPSKLEFDTFKPEVQAVIMQIGSAYFSHLGTGQRIHAPAAQEICLEFATPVDAEGLVRSIGPGGNENELRRLICAGARITNVKVILDEAPCLAMPPEGTTCSVCGRDLNSTDPGDVHMANAVTPPADPVISLQEKREIEAATELFEGLAQDLREGQVVPPPAIPKGDSAYANDDHPTDYGGFD